VTVGIVVALLWARPATANGGTIQVSMERAGPYEVTVLTDPTPIRVGTIDVSVMVERADGDLVQDAQVLVRATPAVGPNGGGSYEATHDRATNKLFYAADVKIPQAGPWQIDVTINSALGAGSVSFDIQVSEPGLLDRLPLLILAVMFACLIVAAGVARYRSTWGRAQASH
jgi:hypothetical protein